MLLACVTVLIDLWTENSRTSVLPPPLTKEVRFVETQENFGAAELKMVAADQAPFQFVLAH